MSAAAPKVNGRTPRVVAATSEPMAHGLASALLAFHAEAPKLKRDQPGQIGSRAYTYTSLDSLLDDVEPLLLKHELLFTAKVTLSDGAPAALYEMEHVPSGESEEWTGPLPCVDPGPQALGSAITYMRRYTLQAYLNLAPGEDDDGAAASQGQPSVHPGNSQPVDRYAEAAAAHAQLDKNPNSPQPVAAPAKPSERPCSAPQRKMLRAKANAAKLDDGQFAHVIMVASGSEIKPFSDQAAAQRWVDRTLDRLPARLVDAVIEGIEGPRS